MKKKKDYKITMEVVPSKRKLTLEEQEEIRKKCVSLYIDAIIDKLILEGKIDLSKFIGENNEEEE
ncbi:hypothetical protein [Priestia megaterium]|uniref:hypothetical protein n=1 Tax=Priestia megaterium TaxID=1404 RepID=UPI0023644BA5|nr:hypothetical protein [Priestia megaterium]MDD1513817.1 hypothetical protein [Priestia megaterium]